MGTVRLLLGVFYAIIFLTMCAAFAGLGGMLGGVIFVLASVVVQLRKNRAAFCRERDAQARAYETGVALEAAQAEVRRCEAELRAATMARLIPDLSDSTPFVTSKNMSVN